MVITGTQGTSTTPTKTGSDDTRTTTLPATNVSKNTSRPYDIVLKGMLTSDLS